MSDEPPCLIPTESDRRRLFYYIKKSSSVTTWEWIGKHYQAFADILEIAYKDDQEHPDPKGEVLVNQDRVVLVLKGYACFEESLKRLKHGDKTPFQWLGKYGHFNEAGRALDYWVAAQWKGETEVDVSEMRSRLWPQIDHVLNEAANAWNVNVEPALEPRHLDEPAPMWFLEEESGPTFLDEYTLFPPGDLPQVPEPEKNVLVKTGSTVPYSGIFEPVNVEIRSRFLGLIKEPVAPADGDFELIGCMNYLHKGSPAPTMVIPDTSETPPGRLNYMPVVWRLIWEDTRYLDGTIPQEEQHYTYREYVPKKEESATPKGPEPHPSIMQPSGDSALKAGRWLLQGRLDVAITVPNQFDDLPQYEGRNVNWIWAG